MSRVLIGLAAVCLGGLASGVVRAGNECPFCVPDSDPGAGTIIASVGQTVSSGGGGSGPTCTWKKYESGFGVGLTSDDLGFIPGTREGSGGVIEVLWQRTNCSGGFPDAFFYVPPVDAAALRGAALDEVVRQIPLPAPTVEPPAAAGGLVRLQTWLAVEVAEPVTATARAGPFWVTVTATHESTAWDMGDGREPVGCEGTGSALPAGVDNLVDVNGDAECGYTYEHVSAPEFTGTDDLAYHNTVTSMWAVTWVDYTGATGSLESIPRATDWTYQVRQIQTQRTDG